MYDRNKRFERESLLVNSLPLPQLLKKRLRARWCEKFDLATIDNGAGDHLFILFTPEGVIIKGFDHESMLSPHAQSSYGVFPGIYDDVPQKLLTYLEDDALEKEDVTFCIWCEAGNSEWRKGNVQIPKGEDDGMDYLLTSIIHTPQQFVKWAENYYEKKMSLDIVTQIFEGQSISAQMIKQLNAESNVANVLKELEELK